MKLKAIANALIIGSILLITYTFIGHDFVKFYLGGKAELIEAAETINALCNENRSCPTAIDGWREQKTSGHALSRDNMLYFVAPDDAGTEHQSFRLVYRFFLPDNWFEAQGGVGAQASSGWKSR